MKLRSIFCLLGLVLATLAFWASVGPTQAALVGYWPLDGNANASPGYGENGTPHGLMGDPAATTDRNGIANGALAFAGVGTEEYVSIAHGGGLNGAVAGTVSMWVKWTDAAQDDSALLRAASTPVGYGCVLGRQFDFDFGVYKPTYAEMVRPVLSETLIALDAADPAAGKITWRNSLYEKLNTPYPPDPKIAGSAAAGLNTWHHVAAVFQADFLGDSTLYVDGVSQGTAKLDALAMLPTDVALTIGAWIGQGGSYSTSSVDDVAVFNDMLSPTQIAALAAQTATPLTVGAGTSPTRTPLRGVTATASSCFYSYGGTPLPGTGTIQTGRTPDLACNGMARMTNQYDGRGGYAEYAAAPVPDPPVVLIDEDWTSHEGMWMTAISTKDPSVIAGGKPWIQFDLGATRTVYELVLWNYNEVNNTDRGIQTADISYSTNGTDWTLLFDDKTFIQATGIEGDAVGQSVTLGANGVTARYFKFGELVNFGTVAAPDLYTGVAEVDFYLTPGVVPPAPIPGDTDGNQIVDAADAKILAANWGRTDITGGFAHGDFNGDHAVNAADASIMAANWGNHTEGAGEGSVPEPSTLVMMVSLLAFALGRKRVR